MLAWGNGRDSSHKLNRIDRLTKLTMTAPIGLFSETSLAQRRDVHTYYKGLCRQIALGDQLGFDFFSMTQAYGVDFPDSTISVVPDPFAMFASQIPNTERIKLLTGIVVAPFHHPAMVLSQAAAVDALSNGRVMLGLGRGHPWLYSRLGLDQSESRERMREYCAMTKVLLDAPGERHTFAGKFWQLEDFELMPQFAQAAPEVFLAQVSGRASADVAIEHGFGMLYPSYLGLPLDQVEDVEGYYQTAYQQHWGTPGKSLVGVQIYAGPDESEARRVGAQAYATQLHIFARQMATMLDKYDNNYEAYKGLTDFFNQMSDAVTCAKIVAQEWPRYLSVWGDAGQCIQRFEDLLARIKPYGLILNIDAGGLPHEKIEGAMRYVGTEVLPALRTLMDR